jgi:hypothetical protein
MFSLNGQLLLPEDDANRLAVQPIKSNLISYLGLHYFLPMECFDLPDSLNFL